MTDDERSAACRDRINRELALFDREYQAHFLSGETKGPEIGSPYLLHHPGSSDAVLLIHGFMAAPHEVRDWADDLFSRGYTVYAPRLAGHGTSAEDLARRNYTDWVESVERGYEILAGCSERISVAGFSTGAGLALHQAIIHPDRYQSVISVSAPMKFSGLSSRLSETVEIWNKAASSCGLHTLRKPFARNHPDNPEINYHRCPIHGFNQVKALMRIVDRGLPGLSVPALIVQGNRDPKVSPRSGRMIYDRIKRVDKSYVEIDFHLHGIVRGEVGKAVFAAAHDFLKSRINSVSEK
jgi:carboxylesterase